MRLAGTHRARPDGASCSDCARCGAECRCITDAKGVRVNQRVCSANTAAAARGTPYGTARTPLTLQAAQVTGHIHAAGVAHDGCKRSCASVRRRGAQYRDGTDLHPRGGTDSHHERQRAVQQTARSMLPTLDEQRLSRRVRTASRDVTLHSGTHLHPRHASRHDAEERPEQQHHQSELASGAGDAACPGLPGCARLARHCKEPPGRSRRAERKQKRARAQQHQASSPSARCGRLGTSRLACCAANSAPEPATFSVVSRARTVGAKAQPSARSKQCGCNGVGCRHQD